MRGRQSDYRPKVTCRDRRGSVLVPVVAAMLILSLCGVALSELVAAQRYQAVIALDSSRAFRIAEAGLWHAAHEGTALPTPIPHAGGSYTVEKNGTLYTSTGTIFDATRRVSLRFGLELSPLDEPASEASAVRSGKDEFEIDLVSISPTDLVIEFFALSSDGGSEELKRLRLDDQRIWDDNGVFTPTGTVALNDGSTADRTIPAGASPTLRVQFEDDQSGTVEYTLVLDFVGGSSATMVFTIIW